MKSLTDHRSLLNIQELYRLLHVKTRVTKEYIIFEISIPLVSRDNYQMYMLIPVPRQQNNNMVTITPISKYIAFNIQRDSYLIVDIDELRACSYVDDYHVCPLKQAVQHLQNDENLCRRANESASSKCTTEKKICTNQWSALNSPSQYFYFCCDTYSIRIICEDQVSTQQLSGAGIINFKTNCIVKGKQFTLHPLQHHTNKLFVSPNIDTPKLDQINHLIHLSISTTEEEKESDDTLNQTFTKIGRQIKDLKSNKEDVDLDALSYHDVHQYAISYVAVVVAIGIIVVWLHKRRGRRCWSLSTRPQEQRGAVGSGDSGAIRSSVDRPPPPPPPIISVVSSGSVCDVPNVAFQPSASDARNLDNDTYASVSPRVALPSIRISARKKDKATSPHNKRASFGPEFPQVTL